MPTKGKNTTEPKKLGSIEKKISIKLALAIAIAIAIALIRVPTIAAVRKISSAE